MQQEHNTQVSNKTAKDKEKALVICVLIGILTIGVISVIAAMLFGSKNEYPSSYDSDDGFLNGGDNNDDESDSTVVFDVSKFANISSEQLISILGTPDNITEDIYPGFVEFPITVYDYEHELGLLQIDIVKDKVTAFTIVGELPYNNGNILDTLNVKITNNDNFSEGDMYKKWECPTESIDLIHITLIDDANDTYQQLSVEFDSQYYREWNLPIFYGSKTPGEYETATKDLIKTCLFSPSTADFPWWDWTYKRNDYYFYIESYVDAENAFGAEIRHYFTVIYYNDTSIIAYAILDGEIVVDNGYIPTSNIIKATFENVDDDETSSIPPVDQPDDFDEENKLYTDIGFPISLIYDSNEVLVNNVEYIFCDVDDNMCTFCISIDLFSYYDVYDFKFKFSLIGEKTNTTREYIVDDINVTEYGGGYLSFDGDFIGELPIDDYTIVFESIGQSEDLTINDISLYVQNVELENSTGRVTFAEIGGFFVETEDGRCNLTISFFGDKYQDNDFYLKYSLVGETTGTILNFSDYIHEYSDYHDGYYNFTFTIEHNDIPIDRYTIVFEQDIPCIHDYSSWKNEVPSTCTQDGTKGHFVCNKCDKYFDSSYQEISSVTINKGHNYEGNVCTRCQYIYYSEGLQFEISDTRDYCTVVGIGTCTDKVIYIPPTYKDKPVTHIGDSAFSYSNIDSVIIPNSITNIGYHAFGISSIKSIIIPNNITHIGGQAFSNCNNLESVCVGGNVEVLEESIFLHCTNLQTVVINEGVEYISNGLFSGCEKLECVSIPNTVTEIFDYAFYGCENLNQINYNGTKEEWLAITKGTNWDSYSGDYMIHCIDGRF